MSKPAHLLFLHAVGQEGETRWGSSCPWEPDDPNRDCLFGSEPRLPCLWDCWEMDNHHPNCPDRELCIGYKVIDGEENVQECWDEKPDECDGFTSVDGDHLHPDNGCGLNEAFSWGGFGDTVFLDYEITDPVIPIPVRVSWDHEGGMTLSYAQPEGEQDAS